MLLNRRHWCVNGTGLMPTNTLVKIWIQIYDFLLHIHVQEVTMSGQNLYIQTSHGHKLLCPRSSCWNKEQSQELSKKSSLPFSTGQLPISELENGRKISKDREFLVCCSLWAHILLILPQSTICRNLGVFLQRKAGVWSFFLGLSDF